jgi:hypothetical protein
MDVYVFSFFAGFKPTTSHSRIPRTRGFSQLNYTSIPFIPNTRAVAGTQPNNINLPLLIASVLMSPKSSIISIEGKMLLSRAQEHIKNWKKKLLCGEQKILSKRMPPPAIFFRV